MIRRMYLTRAKTRNDGTTTVIASTPSPDRYDDVVAANWSLKRYQDNPVIQFGHRYDIPPVGRAESVRMKGNQLVATIRWDDSEENDLGRLVKSQFERGFLNSVSVGFTPTNSTPRSKLEKSHPAYGEKGMYFEGPQELMEISAVPIPANAEALALRGLGAPMRQKHILNIEETDEAWVISYAKGETAPEEEVPEEEEEETQETFALDEDEKEEDEEEEKAVEDEDEEDEEDEYGDESRSIRSLFGRQQPSGQHRRTERRHHQDRLTRSEIRSEVRRVLIDLLGAEPDLFEARSPDMTDPVAQAFGLTR